MSEYIYGSIGDPLANVLGEIYLPRAEVVRCRDCKWFTPEHRYEEEREYGVMEELIDPPDCGNPERCSHHYDSITGKVVPVHIVTDPDGFCKWGERRDVDKRSTSKERAIEGVLMCLIDSSNTVEFDAMTAIEKATRDIMEIMGGDGAC